MNNTVLRVWSQDGTIQVYLEPFENQDIPFTKQASDIRNLGQSSSSFSKTFRVPSTVESMGFFGPLFEVNATSDFNPKKKAPAMIEVDSLPIAEGFIQLVRIYLHGTEHASFELRFFGEVATLSRTIGDKLLTEYDWSAYDHDVNFTNIQTGLTNAGLFSGVIKYSIVDFGRQFTADGSGSINDITSTAGAIQLWMWKPYLKIAAVIDNILKSEGYTYDSSFLTSAPFTKLYMLCHRSGFTAQFNSLAGSYCKVGLTSDQTFTGTFVQLQLNDESSFDFQDPNTLWNAGSYYYDAPISAIAGTGLLTGFSGGYSFKLSLKITSATQQQLTIICGNHVQDLYISSGTHTYIMITPVDLTVNAGDNLGVYITAPASITVEADAATFIEVLQSPPDLTALYFVVGDNLPANTKAIDVIRAMQIWFDLAITPSEENPKHLIIEPYAEWIGTGDVVDWTKKLDRKKDVVIEPTTSLEALSLELTFKESQDIFSQLVKTSAGRIYGRKLLLNEDNDFATEVSKIEAPNETTPLNTIPGSNILIPKLFTSGGQPVDGGLRILYNGGNLECTPFQIVDYDGITFEQIFSYNYFGHYEDPQPDLSSLDFNFGTETPFHSVIAYPYKTLYHEYWKARLAEIYSPEARLVTAYFALTAIDVKKVKFNDTIFVIDTYYRLNKIVDFQTTVEQSTKVELIKLPHTISTLCGGIIPDTITAATGVVNFVDADGNPVAATQHCCNFYGYNWIDGDCLWSAPQGGGGSAPGGGGAEGMILDPYANETGAQVFPGATKAFVQGMKPQALNKYDWVQGGGANAQFRHIIADAALDFGLTAADRTIWFDQVNQLGLWIPDGRSMLATIRIVLIQTVAGVVQTSSVKYEALIGKRAGVTYVGAGYGATLISDGYYNTYTLTLDVATDTERIGFVLATTTPAVRNVRAALHMEVIELKNDSPT